MLSLGLSIPATGLRRASEAPPGNGGGGVTDPHFANVLLLLGFEGADGATSTTDESSHGRTATFFGNAQIDTAQKKFGGSALLLDGIGDRIQFPDSDDWVFDGEFTMEAWVRPDLSSVAQAAIIAQWTNINPNCSFYLSYFYAGSTSKRFLFVMDGDGNPTGQVSINPSNENIDQSVFHHVAVDRDASNLMRLYVDGVMKGSATLAGGANASAPLRIGDRNDGSAPFKGWIDELRITKGVARYASDAGFTPPAAAFPRS